MPRDRETAAAPTPSRCLRRRLPRGRTNPRATPRETALRRLLLAAATDADRHSLREIAVHADLSLGMNDHAICVAQMQATADLGVDRQLDPARDLQDAVNRSMHETQRAPPWQGHAGDRVSHAIAEDDPGRKL